MIAIIGITSSYAYTICAKNNTYVGILKKNVNGTIPNENGIVNGEVNGNQKKQWKVIFNYGTAEKPVEKVITGYAACNEIAGDSVGAPKTNLYTNAGDEGRYCWCEMWPIYDEDLSSTYDYETGITSYWVYFNDYTTPESCASSCTSACANAMATNQTFRSAVFEAVW